MSLTFQSHHAGFFSTTSLLLFQMINYMKLYSKCPDSLDFSKVFQWYRVGNNKEIFYDFFKIKDTYILDNICLENFDYESRGNIQFKKYADCNLDVYFKYVDVYFNLSDRTTEIYHNMVGKYKIDFDNTCSLFLRGNDKATECTIPDYEQYIEKGNELLKSNPDLKFLIQSDEKEFIDLMCNTFPNNVVFYDEIRVINKCIYRTVDNHGQTPENNHKYALNFLVIVYIMSKCKYVVCNSGNISWWILMYRKHFDNYFQLE